MKKRKFEECEKLEEQTENTRLNTVNSRNNHFTTRV